MSDTTAEVAPGPRANGHWHLDKRVPIALLAAMLMQGAAFGFWVGGLAARVVHVEQWQSDNRSVDSRLAVLEEQTAEIARILRSLEERLEPIAAAPVRD